MEYNMTTFTQSSHHSLNSYTFNGKIMLCSVIILFVVVVILVRFYSYARWLFRRHHRRSRPHHNSFLSNTIITNNNNNNIRTVSHQSLDLSLLKQIPIFVYSSTTHKQQLECAVCLSEFEDDEKGRVLPMCNHSFHVDCIDTWFHSHSNCPLCRDPVQLDTAVHPSTISVGELVSVNKPAGSIIAREAGCSSSSLPPLELVGVLVEMPRVESRSLDDLRLGSFEERGFKSPGNPVLSLKRISST